MVERIGTSGDDVLFGSNDPDILRGLAGSDRLFGFSGPDKLFGGPDADTLSGGGGGRVESGTGTGGVPVFSFFGDLVDGGPGSDTADVSDRQGATVVLDDLDQYGIGGVVTNPGGGGKFYVRDVLAGFDVYRDVENVIGSAGVDYVFGSASGGVVTLGNDADIFDNDETGDGVDYVFGGEGSDHIWTGGGNDYLDGGPGADRLDGEDGNDEFNGGMGADLIVGGDGNDTAYYAGLNGTGVVLLLDPTDRWGVGGLLPNEDAGGKMTGDVVTDATGDRLVDIENVIGSNFDDWIYGRKLGNGVALNNGNDVFDNDERFAAVDFVDGGPGNDKIWTGAGDDTLIGGAGDDLLFGEDGVDTAVFAGKRADYAIGARGEGRFKVIDLNPGDGDDGADDLSGIEFAAFADESLALSDISLDLRMSWWEDSNYGMFIHWGLYAISAGSWTFDGLVNYYPDTSEWLLAKKQQADGDPSSPADPPNTIPLSDYMTLQAQFDAAEFDAQAWVDVASEGHADYLVVTAKHHDGFSLWDTNVEGFQYDIANTPLGSRHDPLGELEIAAREAGLKFGLYYSIVDWSHSALQRNVDAPGFTGNPLNDDTLVFAEFVDKEAYKADMTAQLAELVDRYDPDILWFDGSWAGNPGARPNSEAAWTLADGEQIEAYIRSKSPDVILNPRLGQIEDDKDQIIGDYLQAEQTVGDEIREARYWEAAFTINDNWGFNSGDENWKSETELRALANQVVGNGGNLLLNVGPDAEGNIPIESADLFVDLGNFIEDVWM